MRTITRAFGCSGEGARAHDMFGAPQCAHRGPAHGRGDPVQT
jgi:hypothetical protein